MALEMWGYTVLGFGGLWGGGLVVAVGSAEGLLWRVLHGLGNFLSGGDGAKGCWIGYEEELRGYTRLNS